MPYINTKSHYVYRAVAGEGGGVSCCLPEFSEFLKCPRKFCIVDESFAPDKIPKLRACFTRIQV